MPDSGWRALLGQTKRSFWLLFGGIWLLAGLLLLVIGIGAVIEERRWADATRTTGLVLVKEIVPADSDSSTEYRVTFRYEDERGETLEGDQKVDVATWEALTERGPIDVYYLTGSSDPARLAAAPSILPSVLFVLVGLAGAVFGAVVFGRAARNVLRTRRLLASGADAHATVTAVEATDVSFNRRPQFRVRYSYRDGGGAMHTGDSGYIEWEEASTYAEGDTVSIRYDRDRPGDSVWIGRPTPATMAVDAAEPETGSDVTPRG
jgi:hypothetical protein